MVAAMFIVDFFRDIVDGILTILWTIIGICLKAGVQPSAGSIIGLILQIIAVLLISLFILSSIAGTLAGAAVSRIRFGNRGRVTSSFFAGMLAGIGTVLGFLEGLFISRHHFYWASASISGGALALLGSLLWGGIVILFWKHLGRLVRLIGEKAGADMVKRAGERIMKVSQDGRTWASGAAGAMRAASCTSLVSAGIGCWLFSTYSRVVMTGVTLLFMAAASCFSGALGCAMYSGRGKSAKYDEKAPFKMVVKTLIMVALGAVLGEAGAAVGLAAGGVEMYGLSMTLGALIGMIAGHFAIVGLSRKIGAMSRETNWRAAGFTLVFLAALSLLQALLGVTGEVLALANGYPIPLGFAAGVAAGVGIALPVAFLLGRKVEVRIASAFKEATATGAA